MLLFVKSYLAKIQCIVFCDQLKYGKPEIIVLDVMQQLNMGHTSTSWLLFWIVMFSNQKIRDFELQGHVCNFWGSRGQAKVVLYWMIIKASFFMHQKLCHYILWHFTTFALLSTILFQRLMVWTLWPIHTPPFSNSKCNFAYCVSFITELLYWQPLLVSYTRVGWHPWQLQ